MPLDQILTSQKELLALQHIIQREAAAAHSRLQAIALGQTGPTAAGIPPTSAVPAPLVIPDLEGERGSGADKLLGQADSWYFMWTLSIAHSCTLCTDVMLSRPLVFVEVTAAGDSYATVTAALVASCPADRQSAECRRSQLTVCYHHPTAVSLPNCCFPQVA